MPRWSIKPEVKSRLAMFADQCASLIRVLFLALEDAQNSPSGRAKDVRLNLELLQVPGRNGIDPFQVKHCMIGSISSFCSVLHRSRCR